MRETRRATNADARREDGRVGRARRRDASASTERCERWDETRRDETETRGLTKGARERARTRRSRTGVQLKDKWRNLIKFQHLRVDEAAKVPYKAAVKAANAANATGGKAGRGADKGGARGGERGERDGRESRERGEREEDECGGECEEG